MKLGLFQTSPDFSGQTFGGDEEDRTPDLRIANATLSQLSYVPGLNKGAEYSKVPQPLPHGRRVM